MKNTPGVPCVLLPPAPLWLLKGKLRVSQLWGKLSFVTEWNADKTVS